MSRLRGVRGISLGVVIMLGACRDLLTEAPQSLTTPDAFYKTGADLNSATIAIYNSLRGLQGIGNWPAIELASDQARADVREPNATTRSPDYLDWDASTGQTDGYWNIMYAVVTRSNLVLSHGPGIVTLNAQMRDYNLAEAKLLRGYAYFFLTRVYDDVPLLLTPAEQANPRPPRTPVEQVHQAAIKDLTEAEAVLPVAWPRATDDYGIPVQGRLTKGAAQMILADLHAWRSSFMGRAEWKEVSAWATKVIRSGAWQLSDDYYKTFATTAKGNAEMIFVLTNSGKDARTSNFFQQFYYPRDWGFDLGQGGGWGLIHPTDWFLNSYQAGDYRKEAGYISGGCSISGRCVTAFADGPMPYKYRKSDGGADWTKGDTDVPLYRMAEAYLLEAEAQNELGNPAEAIRNINVIRARARRGTGTENRSSPADYTGPTDRASLREAVYMERAWELAFEAKRWYDLVRRDTAEPGYWMNSLRSHDPNSEKLRPLATFRKRFPIPSAQINVNPALAQNPGY